VLQEQSVTPLGQAEPLPIDVRTVCASQAPLARAVAAREFRADLYMRLNGLQIELPPLRKRRVDIPRLFLGFLAAADGTTRGVHPRLIEALCLYDWPGNVRELELVAQRLLAVQRDEPLLELEHLPPQLRERLPTAAAEVAEGESPTGDRAQPDRAQRDRERLADKLLHNGSNLSRACAELGISRQRAYRLLAGKSVADFLDESSERRRKE
jgi:transcriptional regulator with PAS, ATPase and Fis domain